MNPADAESKGLKDGEPVIAFNPLGEASFILRITPDVPQGVAAAKAFWSIPFLIGAGRETRWSMRSSAVWRKKGSSNPIALARRQKTSQFGLLSPTGGITGFAR